ncbi:Gfo/Idh/MocA family protein [Pseudonocardia sp. H11422]|uniref:Gfo/Idh/MocA family protein n=1 Tax=Pseudonocardia sp. H11422 TaxID=2835866 RepID=UPI001BDD07F4|nr:Gfo/Idh/MocA family oxidoreductase [Pseudonocardia sp. H11422]
MNPVRIAVAGAGLIGRCHIEEVDVSGSAELASVVDPGPAGPELANKYGVSLSASLAELFETDKPDGVILATPNQMHVDGGLECVAAGVPVIVEKPIGDTIEGATRLVEAGAKAGVAILTGHHRNYSPIMATAREIVRSGVLGPIVAVTGTALFYKPDDYYEVGGGWRREPGAPVGDVLDLLHRDAVPVQDVGHRLVVEAGVAGVPVVLRTQADPSEAGLGGDPHAVGGRTPRSPGSTT